LVILALRTLVGAHWFDNPAAGGYKGGVTPEPSAQDHVTRRLRLVLAVVAALLVAVAVAAALVVRSRQTDASGAKADCEKEPPKVEFAVAECDGGAAPAQGSTPATPAPEPRH
jgi:hypothetical protein